MDVQPAAAPSSSEHVTLVGEPVVVHANTALVSVVDAAGPLVIETVGAVPDGGAEVIVHVADAEALP